MPAPKTISPLLWFDTQAEEAAKFYTAIFPNSKIVRIVRNTAVGGEHHGREPGSVMLIAFELDGQPFTAINGGPFFKFTEAVSFTVSCDTQAEIDRYWDALSAGGDPAAQRCGWLKDKFGLSWRVVPSVMPDMVADPDPAKSGRVMGAMMQMTKLDLAALQAAYAG